VLERAWESVRRNCGPADIDHVTLADAEEYGIARPLGPVFEADMLDCSCGFRPGRSAHDAPQVLIDESWRGRRWVAETDIASCFKAIGTPG